MNLTSFFCEIGYEPRLHGPCRLTAHWHQRVKFGNISSDILRSQNIRRSTSRSLGITINTLFGHNAMRMTRFGEIFTFKFMPVLLALFLTACASTGAPYRETREVVPDTVQIVVFRPDTFFQGGIPYQVNINGKEAAVLRNGGFSVLDAQPGTVVVEIRASNFLQALFKNPSLSLNGTAKERIFVRAAPQRGNTVSLDVVSQGDAKLELKNLKESQ